MPSILDKRTRRSTHKNIFGLKRNYTIDTWNARTLCWLEYSLADDIILFEPNSNQKYTRD
jgi:hypothetical protein